MKNGSYGPPSANELRAIATVMARSYNGKDDGFLKYLRSTQGGTRVWRARGGVPAGLVLLPLPHYFGGRVLKGAGIACVAVAPEARGDGHAAAMMKACLEEMRRDGVAVSTLYPSTQMLYRSVGYEVSGTRVLWKVAARDIGICDRSLAVRPAGARDRRALRDLQRASARQRNAGTERTEWFWKRVLSSRDERREVLLVLDGDHPVGYVVFALADSKEGYVFELWVRDRAAVTPAAARRILTAIADHRSMTQTVHFAAPPDDPWLMHFPEKRFEATRVTRWMLRIVDVRRALEGRGYPPGLSASLDFDVTDATLPANAGRWRLSVSGGKGRVSRGGKGSVRCDVRGLAPLYAGFMSPEDLRVSGLLEAVEADCTTLRALFAGPSPHLTDAF